MHGKLIVIEGTDCSGKETQSKRLYENLTNMGRKVKQYSFPMYDTPTGKIVGGPYLGKEYICQGYFPELAPNVDAKVSSLYYAADRKYNINKIMEDIENGYDVILDRYLFSNMAHQGGKLETKEEREKMYEWLYKLEVEFLELPLPDIRIFIHMPFEATRILKQTRIEELDQNEASEKHLKDAERSYIEVANKYDFKFIETIRDYNKEIEKNNIKTIDEIEEEILTYINEKINERKNILK